jgi:hypothetical protein
MIFSFWAIISAGAINFTIVLKEQMDSLYFDNKEKLK